MDDTLRSKLARLRAEFDKTGDPETARQIADIEQPSVAPPVEADEAPRARKKAH